MYIDNFDDLTPEQLTALTPEQIAYYIDLACAEAGVKLLPPRPQLVSAAPAPHDVTHFCVSINERFTDRAEAEAVVEAVRRAHSRRDKKYAGGRYSYSGPTYDTPAIDTESALPSVTTDTLYSADLFAREKDRITQASEQKERFEKATKEYNEIEEKRERIGSPILSAINEAHDQQRRRRRRLEEFDRYVELAKGDRETAARFLAAAHSDAKDVAPELFAFEGAATLPGPAPDVDDAPAPAPPADDF